MVVCCTYSMPNVECCLPYCYLTIILSQFISEGGRYELGFFIFKKYCKTYSNFRFRSRLIPSCILYVTYQKEAATASAAF